MKILYFSVVALLILILLLSCAPGEPLDPNKLIPNHRAPEFGYYSAINAPKRYGIKWGKWDHSIIYCEDALLNSLTREICSNHGYDYRR